MEVIMTTVARATSGTIVTLLGTIGSGATMIAKTVDAAASSIDMLDAYVQRAKDQQRKLHLIEDDGWLETQIREHALEREATEAKILAQYAGNTAGAERYNKIVAHLESLFAETKP
jgi:hypothetical protein